MSTPRWPRRTGWRTLALTIGAAASHCPPCLSSAGSLRLAAIDPDSSAALRLYTYPGNPLFAAAAQLRLSGHRDEGRRAEGRRRNTVRYLDRRAAR